MCKISNNYYKTLAFLLLIITASCEYVEYANAEYPDQIIYMPAANYNPYEIEELNTKGVTPTEGNTYRYIIDNENNKFIIPLSIYRAGIDKTGEFEINIEAKSDSVQSLINSNKIDSTIIILPSDRYSLESSIIMNGGENLATFNFEVDLDFLQKNAPDNTYAIEVVITCDERIVNTDLNTTIIIIPSETSVP